MAASTESMAQNDDSVSAGRKEKKRSLSFLVADVWKKDAQTYREEMCPSLCAKAPVWVKENSAASWPGDSESAEVTGSLEDCNTVVKKKKKKRKQSEKQDGVEKELTHDSEAAHETCAPAVKKAKSRKEKQHVADETDVGTPVERLDSREHYRHCPADNPAGRGKNKKNKKNGRYTPEMTEETV